MLILITGLPGSGKSTIARMLAERLSGVVINSDVVRRELFPHERTYSSKETGLVIREIERRVEESLKEGRIAILDALFTTQRSRDAYRKLAEHLSTPFNVIHVIAPEDATKERMELRTANGDASEATFEQYLDRKPYFEQVEGDHVRIHNSGTVEDLEIQIDSLVQKISE